MADDLKIKIGIDATDLNEGLKEAVNAVTQTATQAGSSFGTSLKAGLSVQAIKEIGMQAAQFITDGFNYAIESGTKFETALQSVSAVTGVTGDGLSDLGTRAQDLALQFGGSATTQLEAFQTVLSKFGPDLAKTPDALGKVSESVNILAKAAGLDAAQSVDVLSNAMLQFGVDASDPAKLADESARFINVLAASAKVGAAEIPQVGEAILQAGVAASGAGISFEETNAAIQGLAIGGKVGSEAGVGLRNVMNKLIDGGKEQEDVLKKVGLSYSDLGNTLTTSEKEGGGFAATLEKLKKGLETIENPAEKAAALTKLFGAENASSAGILLNQVDNIKLFTQGVTGTNEAVTQAAINQDTLTQRFEKLKATLEVGVIKAFQAFQPIVKFLFDNLNTIVPILTPFALGLAAVGIAALASSPAFLAATASVGAFTASLLVNPVFLIVAGVAAAVVAIGALSDALHTSTGEALENAEATSKVLETQIKDNKEKQVSVNTTKALTEEFKELANKTNRSKEENEKLRDVQNKLNEKYPELINRTKSFSENLKGVEEAGKRSTDELNRLKEGGAQLEKQFKISLQNIQYASRTNALQSLVDSSTAWFSTTADAQKKLSKAAWDLKYVLENTKSVDTAKKAQDSYLQTLNTVQESLKNSGGIKNYTELYDFQNKATSSAVAALTFYDKKVVESSDTKKVIKDKDDKDTDDTDKKKKASTNLQLKLIDDVLKKYEERIKLNEKNAKEEAANKNLSETTLEQKKKLIEDEISLLTQITDKNDDNVKIFDTSYKSVSLLGKITVATNGEVKSSIAGTLAEQQKASSEYSKLVARLNDLKLNLNKINNASSIEGFKKELERLKIATDELGKSGGEVLTIKAAFSVNEVEYKAKIDALNNDLIDTNKDLNTLLLNANETQRDDILKLIKKNTDEQVKLERESAILIERVRAESITDADARRLEVSLLNLKIKYDKEVLEAEGNTNKLDELNSKYLEDKYKLEQDYLQKTNILYGIQQSIQKALLESFNLDKINLDRKAAKDARDAKLKELQQEEKDLEASLASKSITFDEYQQQLSKIENKRIQDGLKKQSTADEILANVKIAGDKASAAVLGQQGERILKNSQERSQRQIILEKAAAEERIALKKMEGKKGTDEYIAQQKKLEKAQTEAEKNDEMTYGFRTSVLEEFAGKALNQFAILAASGKATLEDFGKVTVQLAFEALQKMIPIYVVSIYGEELAKGWQGIATGAALTLVLYGLFAAAQSAAGFKDGVVNLDGAGNDRSDSIPARLSKGESVITAKATKNNMPELTFMNQTGLPLSEFYKRNLQQSNYSVDENGMLLREIKLLRQDTKQLGKTIYRQTKIEVSGTLTGDTKQIKASIDKLKREQINRH